MDCLFRIHLHVVPRWKGDAFRLHSGRSRVPTARQELDAVAARVRSSV